MKLRPQTVPERKTIPLSEAKAGDRIYVHSTHLVSRLIQGAQWLRWRAGSRWNHMAILSGQDKNGNWVVLQAAGKGISAAYLTDVVRGSDYAIVSADGLERDKILQFATGEVGVSYGFLTIAAIAINLYTPSFLHIDFRKNGTWICSAFAQESSRFGGLYNQWKDIYSVSPAQSWLSES